MLISTALLSGALAGLAGVGEVGGVHFQVMSDISPGYGYSGIVVAMQPWLAQLDQYIARHMLVGVDTPREIATVGRETIALLRNSLARREHVGAVKPGLGLFQERQQALQRAQCRPPVRQRARRRAKG